MASGSKSSCVSGRPLRGQAREIVFNVVTHLTEQKQQHKLKYNVAQATSDATGVSESLVKRIIAEGRQSEARGRLKFSTPPGKKIEHKKKIEIDDFTRVVIRRKIHDFYTVKKTIPTLRKLNTVLEEENILQCSKEFLRKTLKVMGFRWAKCSSKRKILIEKPDIVSLRIQYLRAIRRYREAERNIIYLDETYVHATHTTSRCWQSEDEHGVAEAIRIIFECKKQFNYYTRRWRSRFRAKRIKDMAVK